MKKDDDDVPTVFAHMTSIRNKQFCFELILHILIFHWPASIIRKWLCYHMLNCIHSQWINTFKILESIPNSMHIMQSCTLFLLLPTLNNNSYLTYILYIWCTLKVMNTVLCGSLKQWSSSPSNILVHYIINTCECCYAFALQLYLSIKLAFSFHRS